MRENLYLPLLLSLFLSMSSSLSASHYSQGEILYEWIGDEAGKDSLDYRIYFTHYGQPIIDPGWTGISGCAFTPTVNRSFSLALVSPASPLPNKYKPFWEDTGVHPLQTEGWQVDRPDCGVDSSTLVAYRYVGEISLPSKSAAWTFSVDLNCCRDLSDNLTSGGNLYLEARLNNLLGPNSSPHFASPPVAHFCLHQSQNPVLYWQQLAQSPDGDSISIELDPQGSWQGNCPGGTITPGQIPYDSGFSANAPLPVKGFMQVNKRFGIFKMKPNQVGKFYLKVMVRELDFDTTSLQWQEVARVPREIIAVVSDSCQPALFRSPEICMVTFDPNKKGMRVLVDSNALSGNDSLFLLRTNQNLKHPTNTLAGHAILDTGVPSMGLPVKYRLSAFNACGYYTDTATLHESMALSAQLNGSSAQLSWSPYRGKRIAHYKVYQADSGFGNINYLGQVPNNTFTYTVNSVLSSTTYFLVEAVLQDSSCLPAPYPFGGPLAATQISQVSQPSWDIRQISLYPNPTEGIVQLNWPEQESPTYNIVNLPGQSVQKGRLQQGENRIDLSTLSSGTYLLTIDGLPGARRIIKR